MLDMERYIMTKSKNKRILIILGAALIISFLLHGGYKNMTGSHKANMNKRPATVQLVNVIEKEIYDIVQLCEEQI